jgi:hypothetical protein
MCHSAAAGEPVEFDGPFEQADMEKWGRGRTVRAAVLRHLLVTGEWPTDAKGVRLRGVRISGLLDLKEATLRCPVSLDACYLDASEPACFDAATASRVTLTGCRLAGLTGNMLKAKELDLSRSTLTSPLWLSDADIAGPFRCSGVHLTSSDNDGEALIAERLKVGADVFLDGGFAVAGAVRLSSAEIIGRLTCSGAQLAGSNNQGDALIADQLKASAVFLDDVTAVGALRLAAAKITSHIDCSGAQLTGSNDDGDALFAESATADVVLLTGPFTAAGAVRLAGAEITSQLNCSGARLTGRGRDGNALDAAGVKTGDIVLDKKFTSAGAVSLVGAEITGQLNCRGARLNGRDNDGDALIADQLKASAVFLDVEFTAAGAVSLVGAEITTQLSCSGARLTGSNKYGMALSASEMTTGGSVYLDKKFTAAGAISLVSARIGDSVYLKPAALASGDKIALDAARAQITGTLDWAPAAQIFGQVKLTGAAVGELDDDWSAGRPNGHWPTGGRLRLDGFAYDRFGGNHPATAKQRLDWIRSQYTDSATGKAGFATQPYEQLVAVYQRAGQDAQARDVAIARRADLRRYGELKAFSWAGNLLLDWTIKYGYQAWRAGVGLAIVFVSFLVMSVVAQHHHVVVPVGNVAGIQPIPVATQCTSSYPCFYPVGYAIDVVIPIINVHQADNWGLDGHSPGGWGWVAGSWAATALGWAFVTLLVAGYTGLVRRE